jgi:hypothetical protein
VPRVQISHDRTEASAKVPRFTLGTREDTGCETRAEELGGSAWFQMSRG